MNAVAMEAARLASLGGCQLTPGIQLRAARTRQYPRIPPRRAWDVRVCRVFLPAARDGVCPHLGPQPGSLYCECGIEQG